MEMLSRSRGAPKRHRACESRLDRPLESIDLEKREFYERMPALPIPLDRGRVAKRWMAPGARVLDIGCGAGYHVRHFARNAARVAAVDVDGISLAIARRRVRSRRAAFLQYDGSRLPFADASFDVVTMLDVLEHVADRQAIVEEIARVLRPGGTWIVSVPYRGALRWLSPENMAQDFPRLFGWLNRWTKVRFWIRGHNATGTRHAHFSRDDLKKLASASFRPERSARRGSLLYAWAYLAICFPLPMLGRLWASACFALMALDYQIPYGPCSYNLIMQFRRKATIQLDLAQLDLAPCDAASRRSDASTGKDAAACELLA